MLLENFTAAYILHQSTSVATGDFATPGAAAAPSTQARQLLQNDPLSGVKLLHSAADARYVAEVRRVSGEKTRTDTEEPRHRTSWCRGGGKKEKKNSSLEASSQDIRE